MVCWWVLLLDWWVLILASSYNVSNLFSLKETTQVNAMLVVSKHHCLQTPHLEWISAMEMTWCHWHQWQVFPIVIHQIVSSNWTSTRRNDWQKRGLVPSLTTSLLQLKKFWMILGSAGGFVFPSSLSKLFNWQVAFMFSLFTRLQDSFRLDTEGLELRAHTFFHLAGHWIKKETYLAIYSSSSVHCLAMTDLQIVQIQDIFSLRHQHTATAWILGTPYLLGVKDALTELPPQVYPLEWHDTKVS